MLSTFEFILIGIFTGAMTGISGASGVLVMVPIFSTFLDMPIPIILGISLMVDVIASTSVSIAYARAGNLEIKGIVWMLVGTLLGAQIGSSFVVSVSKNLIMIVLALGMTYFGTRMWKNGFKEKHNPLVVSEKISNYAKTPLGMITSGMIVGLATGIFGAGGGLTIFIVLYSFMDFHIKKAIGTSSFIMLLTALSGVVGYIHHGNLNFNIGLIVGLSAALGGIFSSVIANRISEKSLAKIVGGFFIFSAIFMIILKILFPILGIVN